MRESGNNLTYKKDFYEALLENMGYGVFTLDRKGRIFFVNSAACHILGHDAQSLIGKTFHEIVSVTDAKGEKVPEDQIPYMAALRGMHSVDAIIFFIRKDRARFPVFLRTNLLEVKGKVRGTVNTFRDITSETKQNEIRGALTSVISHQLRTPLTTLRWFLEPLLSGEIGTFSPKQQKFLSTFSQATERIIKLVDTLINAARVEAGEVRVNTKTVDLAAFTKSIWDELRVFAQEESQQLSLVCPDRLPKIFTDPDLLHEVLSNILHNAIRYTPKDGKIFFSVEIRSPDVLFIIKDTGYGIPKKEQHRIFEKMFRASNVVSKISQGTGLGLYIAKFFTELLNGKIWFESKENKGTTFFISIPFSEAK